MDSADLDHVEEKENNDTEENKDQSQDETPLHRAPRQPDPANLARVAFSPATVKDIISKHSGSILVKDEPRPPLSAEMRSKGLSAFAKLSVLNQVDEQLAGHSESKEGQIDPTRDRVLPRAKLTDFINECGFHAMRTQNICETLYKGGSSDLTESEAIAFLAIFFAPSFYFGQRMRRFVGRGETDEAINILARGCEVNCGDGEGLSALHYAAIFDRLQTMDSLFSFAKDQIIVDAQDRYGWAPLHCACYHGNVQCVSRLLDAGARVNITDKNGKTPLHVASAQGRNAVVDLLTSRSDVTINARDKRGMTPLHDAAFKGHQKTYNLLTRVEQADISILDILGNTCDVYMNMEV